MPGDDRPEAVEYVGRQAAGEPSGGSARGPDLGPSWGLSTLDRLLGHLCVRMSWRSDCAHMWDGPGTENSHENSIRSTSVGRTAELL